MDVKSDLIRTQQKLVADTGQCGSTILWAYESIQGYRCIISLKFKLSYSDILEL